MMAGFKHITYNQRLQIEVMYNRLRYSPAAIADTLGFHYSTIYREIKRGLYERRDSDTWLMVQCYSADVAQKDYSHKASMKGVPLKIGNDFELVEYLEDTIVRQRFSPGAALGRIRAEGLRFRTSISKTTLYRYIDDDLFIGLSNKHLPQGKRRPSSYNKVRRIGIVRPMRQSIEQRPPEIESRTTFGHWEMDTVVGRSHGVSTSLLVLTERKTRNEIVIKIKRRTTAEVVKALDRLQRNYKSRFRKVFKSITVDNGSEFFDTEGMEKGGRTKIYYCHPFSSWERGSNENNNKLIRRFIPKGTSITQYTNKEIAKIEHWMNSYPRKIFGYKTSGQLFNEEIEKLTA